MTVGYGGIFDDLSAEWVSRLESEVGVELLLIEILESSIVVVDYEESRGYPLFGRREELVFFIYKVSIGDVWRAWWLILCLHHV